MNLWKKKYDAGDIVIAESNGGAFVAHTFSESHANLIVAAPDLLAAAAMAIVTIDTLISLGANLDARHPGDNDDVWRQLRAAVARARGEQGKGGAQ